MTTKFLALVSVISLAGICLVQGQSPTPSEPPAVSPSPAESPAASPSPAKHRGHKKAEATPAASPAAASTAAVSPSPAEKRGHKKAKTAPAASPAPAAAATKATAAAGGGPGLVWVNTDTHIYHKQGSRFYGKTKTGKYMSEADARKEGNRPAAQEY